MNLNEKAGYKTYCREQMSLVAGFLCECFTLLNNNFVYKQIGRIACTTVPCR